jgi:hypothetical protein
MDGAHSQDRASVSSRSPAMHRRTRIFLRNGQGKWVWEAEPSELLLASEPRPPVRDRMGAILGAHRQFTAPISGYLRVYRFFEWFFSS